jgi:hypothetical protein
VLLIRDAFAHGRLVTTTELPATLWKFGAPTNGRVPIEFSQVLTLDWLKETSKFIDDQREKVVTCYKARGLGGLKIISSSRRLYSVSLEMWIWLRVDRRVKYFRVSGRCSFVVWVHRFIYITPETPQIQGNLKI